MKAETSETKAIAQIKKEEDQPFSLAESSLIRRYTANNCKNLHLPIPSHILNHTYSRPHISSLYGGNVQVTWVTVSRSRIRDGVGFYACPRTNWNPHMPRRPGECGVLFHPAHRVPLAEFEDEDEATGTGTGMGRRRTPLFGREKEGEWIYFGDYEFRASEPVSVQEWRDSPMETKLICLEKIRTLKSWSAHPINTITLARKIKQGGVPYLEPADLDEALVRGEWVFETCTVNCTGYNKRLQETLIGETFKTISEAELGPELDHKPSTGKTETQLLLEHVEAIKAQPHVKRKSSLSPLNALAGLEKIAKRRKETKSRFQRGESPPPKAPLRASPRKRLHVRAEEDKSTSTVTSDVVSSSPLSISPSPSPPPSSSKRRRTRLSMTAYAYSSTGIGIGTRDLPIEIS
ncbi:hypothetical protein SISSUDRAFT_877215 [Sistotremastrum suecicum HHB10207 ss-3]|uniref:DUF6697 domain-containing protein n=1 Tax=Sistotremastrum suecicum HHB10207 ss-3 TaxID=1314776 RepID=A0A166C8Y2_9AGAM|nr:hypothetical protein SISSUDRAFT_877215 [Sistotremastrum suecicum HHB10207 ss-3]